METIDHIRALPELGTDAIHIWGVHVPAVLDRLDALRAVLAADEREKAGRLHREADRQTSIAARGALRILLSGYMGVPAAGIAFSYSENGKPHVAGTVVEFNLSHSGDWVVLAFGRNRQIGVDIERIKRDMDVLSIASRYFTPEETARIEEAADRHALFFRLWAHKEAYVKACGSGLFRELSSFCVPAGDGEKDGWHFRRLESGSEYASAVVTDKPLATVPCYDFGGLEWQS